MSGHAKRGLIPMTDVTISVGDVVEDREETSPDGVVLNRPPIPTSDWHVQDKGPVSLHNPEYPDDDRTIIVVYFDELESNYPNYTGGRPIPISQLNRDDVEYYAFPETRLRPVDFLDPIELQLEEISPAPYHARNFSAATNRDYIDAIAERGRPKPLPLVRDCDHGFELLNGHKRIWASYVAGLETIPVECIYLEDFSAAKRWAKHHLEGYGPDERAAALDRLHDRFNETQVEQITQPHLPDDTQPSPQLARTDGGRSD